VKAKITLLPGDGIGPEVTEEARKALEHVAALFGHQFIFEEHLIGGIALDKEGGPLSESTLETCRRSNGVLLGAVGGPKWDDPEARMRPEDGLLRLRKDLELFINLRPIQPLGELTQASSPIRSDRLKGVNLLIVRELTGGLYFGQPRGRETLGDDVRAVDTLAYTAAEIRRLVDFAFRAAERRSGFVTSVDKANVLETSRLWRLVVNEVAESYPAVSVEHMLVDAAAMRLMDSPARFDVLVTENMFGDILSDEASVLVGSLGLLPSASLGSNGSGVFEPVHGSAPDIAGQGIANPVGALLSAAMLLRYGLDLPDEASRLEAAVRTVVAANVGTPDIGGSDNTAKVGQAVREAIVN
jgi:3-isopropylmalate dehydrogenase